MQIRKITESELPEAMDLVWKVFLDFEAPDYPQEGIDEFRRAVDGQLEKMTLDVYGAFKDGDLLGIIATRNEGSHITFFFVKKEYHNRGVGGSLFQHIVPLTDNAFITVNSSPYAVKIYRKLGFIDTDTQQQHNGIIYVPMKYIKKS